MYLIVLFQKESKTDPVAKEWQRWPPYSDKNQILRSVQKKAWKQFTACVLFESGIFLCRNMQLRLCFVIYLF